MELQRKASTVGFDWNDPRAVLHKIREEADEIEAALDSGDAEELAEETGDLLFALVNLARHVGADPETGAARHQRQIRAPLCLYRARAGGARAARWRTRRSQEMDALWNEAKAREAIDGVVDPGKRATPLISRRVRHGIEPRLTTMSRLVSSTRTVMSNRPS